MKNSGRIGRRAGAVFSRVRPRETVRCIGLMAGAFALMLQVFAWTLTMPAKTATANGIAGGIANGIIVCTAEGLVHLDVDGPPFGTDTPAKHSDTASCPLCPLIGGLHLPPPIHLVLRQAVARHGPEGLPGALVVAGWFLSTLQARAPPV